MVARMVLLTMAGTLATGAHRTTMPRTPSRLLYASTSSYTTAADTTVLVARHTCIRGAPSPWRRRYCVYAHVIPACMYHLSCPPATEPGTSPPHVQSRGAGQDPPGCSRQAYIRTVALATLLLPTWGPLGRRDPYVASVGGHVRHWVGPLPPSHRPARAPWEG